MEETIPLQIQRVVAQHLLIILATFLPISSFVCSQTGTSPMYISKKAPNSVEPHVNIYVQMLYKYINMYTFDLILGPSYSGSLLGLNHQNQMQT